MPSGVPAKASMRPNWPPPITPIFIVKTSGQARVWIVQHAVSLFSTECFQNGMELGVLGAQDAGGQQRRIDCAGFTDGQCRNRNARRHLHDGQQRVDTRQHRRLHGHTEHRQMGFRGTHAGQRHRHRQ